MIKFDSQKYHQRRKDLGLPPLTLGWRIWLGVVGLATTVMFVLGIWAIIAIIQWISRH